MTSSVSQSLKKAIFGETKRCYTSLAQQVSFHRDGPEEAFGRPPVFEDV
jgi:hypothetical protein